MTRNLIGLILYAAMICAMCACNMTRTVTTTSQFVQRGDTTFVIQTKTTEVVDGTVKYQPFNR